MPNISQLKQGPRLTRVSFQPWHIPVVRSESDVDRYLVASLLGSLPGIILTKEVRDGLGVGDHAELVDFIRGKLYEQGAEFKAGPTKTKIKPHGVGDLHTDGVEAVSKVLNFNVHSTNRGAGDVLLALPGPNAKRLIDAEGQKKPGLGTLAVRSVWERPLHNLALSNETFAELIDSNGVYSGELNEGDGIVIALESQRGPMFHRFDTSSKDREASITELNRPD